MLHSWRRRIGRRSIGAVGVVVLTFALLPSAAAGQTGRIGGSVLGESGTALSGAFVELLGTGHAVLTRPDGGFVIDGVQPGRYQIRVWRIGYAPVTREIEVGPDEEFRAEFELTPSIIQLDGIALTLSRRPERVATSTASIATIPERELDARLGNALAGTLSEVPGISVARVGVTSATYNGRGFNKLFNTRWLTLEDGRVATLVETGLPIGEHTPIPRIDVEAVEVMAGSGAALHGANAVSGLLALRTKDPRRFPGLAVEASGGVRSYHDLQARYAVARGRWGFKAVAEAQGVGDFADTIQYPSARPGGGALPEISADFHSRTRRAGASIVYYPTEDARLILNGGMAQRNGVGQFGLGRYQLVDSRYSHLHLRFEAPGWMVQSYTTGSDSGDTYLLPLYTQLTDLLPNLPADSIRARSAFPVEGRLKVVEAQHNAVIGSWVSTGIDAIDRTAVLVGGQLRWDRVSSGGRVYSDAITGEPIRFEQRSGFAQVETPIGDRVRITGAARYDHHSAFGGRWSPMGGVIAEVSPDRFLRASYTRAYLAPPMAQTDVYQLNPATRELSTGNRSGFEVRDAGGTVLRSYEPIGPETSSTWEIGFRGWLSGNLHIDLSTYRSTVREFIGVVTPIANPRAPSPTFAYDMRTGERMVDAQGVPLLVRTFFNAGRAVYSGIDTSLRWQGSRGWGAAISTSFARLDEAEIGPNDPPEIAGFNTPSHRTTATIDLGGLPSRVTARITARTVAGYDFHSGSDRGFMPGFSTLGAAATVRLGEGMMILLQAENIAGCVSGISTPPAAGVSALTVATYTSGRECGFGVEHHEMLNMPAIGPVLMAGVRFER